MKLYKISIILLFLLIFSIGAICAEDVDNTNLDSTSDVIAIDSAKSDNTFDSSIDVDDNSNSQIKNDETNSGKTFDDLSNLINSSTSDTIEIKDDYTYNTEKDTQKRIYIKNKLNLVFEGNGHIIDGNGIAGLFEIDNSNITLKNMIIRNCNDTAILLNNSYFNTINVTFENNTCFEQGGAIYAISSTITSTDDKFINNYAEFGSSIYLSYSIFNGRNNLFLNKIPVKWSMLYGTTSEISITDSIFTNTSSKYATAIYNDYITIIKRSKFINLYANLTGGAIAIKGANELEKPITTTIIEECDFMNVTSVKNGGALYLDIAGPKNMKGEVLINGSKFTNCNSMFGGALLQLGGNLYIINSIFEDNLAYISGGAVYTSNTNTSVEECNFTNNNASAYYGGALFIDYGKIEIDLSNFTKNYAINGGGIYIYDSVYNIERCDFTDNGEAIYSCYDLKGSYQKNNKFKNDKIVLDQPLYGTYVDYEGKQIILNPLKIEGSPSDPYFNLAKQGLVTPVKDQGHKGACWAFGIAGAFESAFLIATNITLDISENNIQNLGLRYSPYGSLTSYESGDYLLGAGYILGWLGAVSTENDEYDELGKISPVIFDKNAYHIVDAIFVNTSSQYDLKEALTQYGALDLYIYGADKNTDYYNPETYALYYNGKIKGNHYVTLVGWDDNFSADNFKIKPEGNGAWICKNSWGTDWGDNGYFYLSYYDNSLKLNVSSIGFVINNTELYNKLYQYDVCGFSEDYYTSTEGPLEYMNVYTAVDEDLIAAVGTYFEYANSDYTITIYVNGSEMYSQSGKSLFSGFNTIKLNQYILITEGDEIAVKIKSASVPALNETRIQFEKGTSFIITSKGMIDTTDKYLVTIKTYTIKNPSLISNIKEYYSAFNQFIVFSDYENVILTLKQNGKNIANATVKDGIADFGIVLNPGMYALVYALNNTTIISNVEILNTIQIPHEITIGYNTELTITPAFIDDWGYELNGIEVKYKFDKEKEGSLYTNESGEITIELRPGTPIGTHKLILKNLITGENLTVKINILSRFSGNKNINMYYNDGSEYKVRIVGNNGQYVGAGVVVTIKIGSNTFKVKTDKNGYATLKIPNTIAAGKHTITATIAGQTVKNTLQIKHVLKSTKTVTVKKTAKTLVLKATLKGKTALKNKVVKFKVNGKTYSGKTNSKGSVKVTIKQKDIKKLKAGKKYTVAISYLKDTIKTTLNVRR